jgi:putative transposase
MPKINSIKYYEKDGFYHIYTRGVNKMSIFLDKQDYERFLFTINRVMGLEEKLRADGVPYPNYSKDVEVNAYCLMGNHIHMLVHVIGEASSVTKFMHSIFTSYATYFNKKYGRVGHLFQDVYKAKHVNNDIYFKYVSKYIHKNHKKWLEYKYSSLRYFLEASVAGPAWLMTKPVLEQFRDKAEYLEYMNRQDDYLDYLLT